MTPLRLTPEEDLDPFVAALAAGRATVVPTDTVYGLACAAHLPDACERALRIKQRDLTKPTSVVAASLDTVFATVLPELFGRAGVLARRLLPGPVTVVVPNPGRRFRWLCGPDPSRIGLRVPVLPPSIAEAIDRIGAIAATSANLPGEPDPASLAEVPEAILSKVAVAIDGGPTPIGKPSTVVDLTGREPVVLREGALSEAEILALLVDC
jgi:tRNA threonylcarbamoyl adenosine modification protein (Sua5/YciO/YrdC/YwlC family)